MDELYRRTLLFGATPQTACVHVKVVALDEEDNVFHWHATLLPHQRLQDLAVAWSNAYRVPVEQVGLETQDHEELQLSHTARQLGWRTRPEHQVIVYAIPVQGAAVEVHSTTEELEAETSELRSLARASGNTDAREDEASDVQTMQQVVSEQSDHGFETEIGHGETRSTGQGTRTRSRTRSPGRPWQ